MLYQTGALQTCHDVCWLAKALDPLYLSDERQGKHKNTRKGRVHGCARGQETMTIAAQVRQRMFAV